MSQSFSLVDALAVSDLQVYLSRAGRVEDGSVRLVARGGVLAVYTAVLYPHGLLDRTPTVLGLRTFATDPSVDFDAVVPTRSLLDRLARVAEQFPATRDENAASVPGSTLVDGSATAPIGIRLPLEVSTVTWAGISPPRSGWLAVGETTTGFLEAVAKAGIDEVAQAIPSGTGEQLVWRVRGDVWGAPIEGLDYVAAGAAFAADSLGFLAPGEQVPVFETGPWTRLSTSRGHVLVRRPAWSLRAGN